MHARGRQKRHLQTQGGREVTLNRRYLTCRHCGYSFFLLHKELDLPATGFLPHAHQYLVRWGSKMPFVQATKELEKTFGIHLSASTVRR